jgi:hypothetical protein
MPTLPSSTTITSTQHQLYTAFLPIWQLLADVREGTGGFLDGTYLIAHPREWKDYDQDIQRLPTKALLARRKLACYENFAGTILEAKTSALFREVPTRRFADPVVAKESFGSRLFRRMRRRPVQTAQTTGDTALLQQWWENVDGAGTHIDDFMAQVWDVAATFGHVWLYVDRPAGTAGETLADTVPPFVRAYTPLDAVDWTVDDQNRLTRIVFREPAATAGKFTQREVTTEYWAWYDENGELTAGGPQNGQHKFGCLPVVQLFGRRRPLYRHIGQSVLGDPKLYQDLFNLTSETRQLLRAQTFSFINIPLGVGDGAMTVEQAKTMLGEVIGAMNVIFSGQAAQILSADAENVTVYHKEFDRRLRVIYRQAGVQFEADSKDAEAQGSLKLKREDMNTRLAAYADELEKADYALAKLWFLAMRGAEKGAKAYEDAKLEIRYPDSFDMTPFDAVLQQAQSALALDFPQIVMNEILKALLPKFLPDLDEDKMQALIDAIDNRQAPASGLDSLRQRLQVANGNMTATADAQAAQDTTAASATAQPAAPAA